jgi:hypothetical protein
MKWLIRTLLALALFALLWTPAAACSATFYHDSVVCPGEGPVTADTFENLLSKISPACAAALGPEVVRLHQEHRSHRMSASKARVFSAVPWSPAAEAELRANERPLSECGYQRWQRSGDWLVSQDAVRSYCTEVDGLACGAVIRFSWVQFLGFALVHPGAQTWPYALGGWLALLGAGFWLIRLRRRRQLDAFLRSSPAAIWGIAATLLVMMCPLIFISWIDIVASAGILYLLACFLRWGAAPVPDDQ